MKNIYLLFVLFLSAVICLSPSCKKHDDNTDPLSQLPPATTTGANTFGCLVNGQAFTPHAVSTPGNYSTQCNYIYTNGGYYFSASASNDSNSSNIVKILLNTTLLPINEGQTLKLENRNEAGKAYGLYDLINTNIITYQTTTIVSGQLHITKFDQSNQIVSGTFNFNALRTDISKSDTVHVTEGRFDMKYTQ